MTDKQPPFSDLNQLAIEACDMWQEHLSTLASSPEARSELTRFLEPQRRLFSDWASMMQQGLKPEETANSKQGRGTHDTSAQNQSASTATNDTAKTATSESPAPAASTETPRGPAYGDDSLRVAQLALRVAELEKRLAKLESKPEGARKSQRNAS